MSYLFSEFHKERAVKAREGYDRVDKSGDRLLTRPSSPCAFFLVWPSFMAGNSHSSVD